MGQYYCAVNPKKREFLSPHDFGNGAKLMEHSYIGNSFLNAVESLLSDGGGWHGDPLVWAGDYGDKGAFLEGEKPFVRSTNPEKFRTKDVNLYEFAGAEFTNLNPEAIPQPDSPLGNYIVNHTKHEYVRKDSCPKDKDGYSVHPLSLLVSNGNGNGGGDYRGSSMNLVGTWAGDCISIECEAPENHKEIRPDFEDGEPLLDYVARCQDIAPCDVPKAIDAFCARRREDDVVRSARILLALSADNSIPISEETIAKLTETLSEIRSPETAERALELISLASYPIVGLDMKRFFSNLSNECTRNKKRFSFGPNDGQQLAFILDGLKKLTERNEAGTISSFMKQCIGAGNAKKLRKINTETVDKALMLANGNNAPEPAR